jgi:hypothetical protein
MVGGSGFLDSVFLASPVEKVWERVEPKRSGAELDESLAVPNLLASGAVYQGVRGARMEQI